MLATTESKHNPIQESKLRKGSSTDRKAQGISCKTKAGKPLPIMHMICCMRLSGQKKQRKYWQQ
jgi:hypothetical protein